MTEVSEVVKWPVIIVVKPIVYDDDDSDDWQKVKW